MRPLPWTELVAALGEERFAAVRDALTASGADPLNRDAFLLDRAVAALLRDLVPQEGAGAAIAAYGALLHTLYLAWVRDWPVAVVPEGPLRERLSAPPPIAAGSAVPAVCYFQLPERRIWAETEPGRPHEPLDGLWVVLEQQRLRVLAVLDFREGRGGFTTMDAEIALPAAAPAPRPDGSPPFASLLPGGDRASLLSLADPLELAALGRYALVAASLAPPPEAR